MWVTVRAVPGSCRQTLRGLGVAALLSMGLAACSSNPAGPTPPRTFNLDLLLSSVAVSDNCEDADGNPGEWTWRIEVRAPGRSVATSTDNYPSASGGVLWGDNGIYTINRALSIIGFPEADISRMTITLSATEWDGDTADPDMNNQSVTNLLALSMTGKNQFIWIDRGRCDLQFTYRPTFAEVQ